MPRKAGARGASPVLAFLLGLAVALPAAADVLPALYDVAGVDLDDRLNVREKPDAGSAIAGTLAPDTVDIEVTGLSRDGSWARINLNDRAAWVALRFLRRQEGPAWWDAEVPLSCYGTEPFWGLGLADGVARYDSPSGRASPEAIGARAVIVRGDGGDALLGLRLGEGFAVIRSGSCSDGMSDRANALSIELFREGEEGFTGLTGCCSLIR